MLEILFTRMGRLATLALLLGAGRLDAHPMPASAVLLDFAADRVGFELQLPVDRLEVARGTPVTINTAGTVVEEAELRRYLLAHLGATAPTGEPWRVELGDIRFTATAPAGQLHVTGSLRPPAGAPLRRFTLNYQVIAHQIVTHTVIVSLRRDWLGGKTSAEPEPLGIIRYTVRSLEIDRGAGGTGRGFLAIVSLGMHHIAEGTDHILFLLTLLLPTPLVVRAGRWSGADDRAAALRRLGVIVTAFTLGHSATLAAGALGWWRPPAQPVEALIALSILISALHVLRPGARRGEAWLAGGFGLIHGLAFASALASLRVEGFPLVLSLLGFNLGVELGQLAIAFVTVPWLLLLAESRAYNWLRIGGAGFAALAGLGWFGERACGWSNPCAGLVDGAARLAPWLLAALAATALVRTAGVRRRIATSVLSPFL